MSISLAMSLFDYGLGLNVLIISNLMRKKASGNNEIRSLLIKLI
ncbi:MAG: hypothetical protein QOK59_03975 [Nitrososphaeraceae archaeon]|nr:hypothetical protein [Nitrososphaeraceae archaeon]MDW0147827.1 hypothetical protein [Nitrososphaeraceae archaeon]MDW0166671.1 hypothetical protein [Nitrososphaeraceae archaeon]